MRTLDTNCKDGMALRGVRTVDEDKVRLLDVGDRVRIAAVLHVALKPDGRVVWG